MKLHLSLLLLSFSLTLLSQETPREIALEGALEVRIHAEFSSVFVTTGGTDALLVSHSVAIAGQERPELRKLTVEREGDVLHLREVKPSGNLLHEQRPSANYLPASGGQLEEKGASTSLLVDATLKVVVPANVKVSVSTNFGSIKTVNVAGLLSARARYGAVQAVFASAPLALNLDLYSSYGAVDVTIPADRGLDVDLTTKYGDVRTDLGIEVDASVSKAEQDFQQLIGKVAGGGRVITCTAPYGDVYLRKG